MDLQVDRGRGDVIVIIPAHNEEAVIGDVIRELKRQHALDILVADDASTDATARYAQAAGATVLPLSAQLGAWGATQAGLRYAYREGYQVAVTMDGDGQHPAEAVPTLLDAFHHHNADLCIGSNPARGSKARRIAWRLLRLLSGLKVQDLTSGLRVYGRRAMAVAAERGATLLDFQDVGLLMLFKSAGLTITEIPVSMRPRANGKSRIFHSWLAVGYYMSHTAALCISKRNRVRVGPRISGAGET